VGWHGWVLRRGRWERVCQASTVRDCHLALLAWIEQHAPHVPSTARGLTTGQPPTWGASRTDQKHTGPARRPPR
jgi:hypothetical protein